MTIMMSSWTDLVPAEQEDRKEPGLEEERKEALGRQRTAEHIANEPRVVRPVRSEFELHHHTRRDSERECQPKDPNPEFHHLPEQRVVGLEEQRAHDHDDHAHPNSYCQSIPSYL